MIDMYSSRSRSGSGIWGATKIWKLLIDRIQELVFKGFKEVREGFHVREMFFQGLRRSGKDPCVDPRDVFLRV
jgi:hypothetical protein